MTYYAMGIPVPQYTPIFVASRITGWCAHIMEQHQNNRIIRPLAEYTGPELKSWNDEAEVERPSPLLERSNERSTNGRSHRCRHDGGGIALVAASHGYDVLLIDVSDDQLGRANAYHAKTTARNVEKGRMSQDEADAAPARIQTTTEMARLADADWIVEAATENADLKKKIFQQMAEHARDDVVLATNTSSISITDLASAVPGAEDRVIGMHFFNPVPIMKLVEVIKGRANW